MAKYKLSDDPNFVIDVEHVPQNVVFLNMKENAETIKYQKWLDSGNTPDPYDNFNYAENRKKAYPSVEDQLDILYHKGFDEWASIIKDVKDKYPKPVQLEVEI